MLYQRYSEAEMSKLCLGDNLPAHVGLIMDGNGRWAKARHRPRAFGHRAGMEALHNIVLAAHRIGLKAITVYAFSTENWLRPSSEVNALFSLLIEYFNKEIAELHENSVRVRILGEPDKLPKPVCAVIRDAVALTANNTGLDFCIALNYGGRAEIVHAVAKLIMDGVAPDSIDEATISKRLYAGNLPDADLIIRTAGEKRLSNFLLWQAAYAELVFTRVLWPDFSDEVFFDCIREYTQRVRRFGKVIE